MITSLGQREVFHLLFLRQLVLRLKPNSYALKGGVNLRFFYDSPRYSEDMDLDVRAIEPFKLKEVVLDILSSKALRTALKPFQIDSLVLPDMKTAKQTDTTQRFKLHLMTMSSEDLFTKIEFSRRSSGDIAVSETISDGVLKKYMLPPLIVSHYPADSAITQKVGALAGRMGTQARDIFDLFILLPRSRNKNDALKKLPKTVLKKAHENIFALDFNVFRDTVLNYLSDEDRKGFDRREVWEEIQLKVSEWIK